MWEQIAHIGRFTAGRQGGLVWFVEAWGTWRWEHWRRGDETWREAGQAQTEADGPSGGGSSVRPVHLNLTVVY